MNSGGRPRTVNRDTPCGAPDCDRLVGPKGAKGMCGMHYNRSVRGTLEVKPPSAPIVLTQPPGEPACVGEHELFDSTDRGDHELARMICGGCPVAEWCADLADQLKKDHAHCRPLTGTWAGRLYGRPSVTNEFVQREHDEPDFTDAELRAYHRAYYHGARDEMTMMGERIYCRRRKAARRKTLAGAA